ncbi:MAG TPA: hypothetical protein VF516_03570 [Kofleriaceae bacterium]
MLGLALERQGARLARLQVLLEIDVAREPPAADPEQRHRHQRPGKRGEQRAAHAEQPRQHAPDPEHQADARRRVRAGADQPRRARPVERKQVPLQGRRDEQERGAHQHPDRQRHQVEAEAALQGEHRHHDDRDRKQPPGCRQPRHGLREHPRERQHVAGPGGHGDEDTIAHRPASRDHDTARDEILELAGVRYDPELVAVFHGLDRAAWRAVAEQHPG